MSLEENTPGPGAVSDRCQPCGGSGALDALDGSSYSTCTACDGHGVAPVVLTPDLQTSDPDFRHTEEPCQRCAGHGTVGVAQSGEDAIECPECGGAGKATGDGSGWDGSHYHHPPCEVCGDRGEIPAGRTCAKCGAPETTEHRLELHEGQPYCASLEACDLREHRDGTVGVEVSG